MLIMWRRIKERHEQMLEIKNETMGETASLMKCDHLFRHCLASSEDKILTLTLTLTLTHL